MLKNVRNISFKLDKNGCDFSNYREEIDNYWNKFSKEHPDMFNGDVLSVSSIEELDGDYNLTINAIEFCDIVYAKMVGNIKTRSLFSAGYILTNDNYVCFLINKNNIVNLFGGMASLEDFRDDTYDPNLCIEREFKEETGLDINSEKINYSMKYLKYPSESENIKSHYPVGIIYEIKVDYSKDELDSLFNKLEHDNEIKSILYLKLDENVNLDKYTKKEYIDELYGLIKKENNNYAR